MKRSMIICNKQAASCYIQVASQVVERIRTYSTAFSPLGGSCPHKKKKKKNDLGLRVLWN